ncbi:reverse transcriptase domain-containing protein [Tanacetum coccineum]
MEAQYGKFLDMIRAVRINVPPVDVLARMRNYGKFLKELISNKHKIEQIFVGKNRGPIRKISATFLSDESSAMIQNKVPPKLGDPESFLIPCNFNKTFSCNALADLGASINLMPYSLYAKLSLETLKPTKMSVRLADRSFQYPVGIAKNMLIEVGKFTFPADFVILEMEEDSKVPLILRRPFLHTVMHIDVIDEILEEDFDALLDEGRKILHSIEGTLLEEEIFSKFNKFIAMTADENSESESDTEEPPFEKIIINTDYKIKTSLEEPPTDLELKPLHDNIEYVFLEEPSFLPVIISSRVSAQNKSKLIQLLDDKKPVVQKQRRLNPNMQEVVKKEIVKLLDTGIIYPIGDSPWRMPFGLCNALTTFQRCMLAIFHDMIEESIKVFMDDFSVFGNSFDKCLNNLDKMLQCCKDAHLVLNREKCRFMVKEGIVLGHKVSSVGLEVDKAKINEFDIEIKDKKRTKNVAANHLSQIENDESSDESEVDNNFPGETLMEINTKDEPWFTDFANYLVADIIPKGITYQQKNKFFSDIKHYFWEEPYLFKVCSDEMIRRCVSRSETRTILDQCHYGPTGGHYGPNITAKKVLD